MSTKAKIIYLSLAAIFLSVTLGCIYYLMGGIIPGVNELSVYSLDARTRFVVGMPYEGAPNTKEADELFVRYRDWIIKDQESARTSSALMKSDEIDDNLQFNFLSVINYPTGDKKRVKQFIGVAIRGSSGQLPMGDEEVLEISCDRRYTVFLPMNSWVRPPIDDVEKMIHADAKYFGDKVDFFYEIYYPDGSMQLEGFVVD